MNSCAPVTGPFKWGVIVSLLPSFDVADGIFRYLIGRPAATGDCACGSGGTKCAGGGKSCTGGEGQTSLAAEGWTAARRFFLIEKTTRYLMEKTAGKVNFAAVKSWHVRMEMYRGFQNHYDARKDQELKTQCGTTIILMGPKLQLAYKKLSKPIEWYILQCHC